MGFEIKSVLNLKVTSIPADNGKSINIEALNDADSRQKLYSLLRVCFDKAGKKKGVLEAVEMKALYNEAGGKIDKQKLSKLLAKFKFALFLYKQGAPQKANETEQRVKELIVIVENKGPQRNIILQNIQLRTLAVRHLGEIGATNKEAVKDAVPMLIAALKDPDDRVRRNAARALGRIGPVTKEVIPALIATLAGNRPIIDIVTLDFGKDSNTAGSAAWALARIGSAAVPALISALKHDDDNTRSFAARALGRIGPAAKEAVHALIKALSDRNDYVRDSAARALGRIGPAAKEAIPRAHSGIKG